MEASASAVKRNANDRPIEDARRKHAKGKKENQEEGTHYETGGKGKKPKGPGGG